jgi:aspartyl aminopeptidase
VGAESNFLESVIGRLATSIDGAGSEEDAVHRTIANSFLVSSDMGHAIHPAFPGKHEVNLRPVMNGGPAIKTNANQRYATSSETNFLLKRVARLADVPLQEYGVRNDCPCGSTIGPCQASFNWRAHGVL